MITIFKLNSNYSFTVLKWLIAEYGSDDHLTSWDFTNPNIQDWAPASIYAFLNIYDDTLATLVRLKFSEQICDIKVLED